MYALLDATSARYLHAAPVVPDDQVNHAAIHRAEYARLRRRDRVAAQPIRRARGFILLAGLRRRSRA